MRKFVAGVASVALLAGVAVAAPSTARSAPTGVVNGPSTIAWGTCSDPDLTAAGAQCAALKVPLDYSEPAGRTITLALSRVAHTSPDADYQGVMLVNPGGPGGSGLGLSVLGEYVPNGGGAPYDWIGWDPRGVGSSKPALSCKPYYQGYDRPPFVPKTKKLLARWKQRSKSYAAACKAARPALIKHLKTKDSVRDMESIRKALGAEQINYYGFSYGTYLGAAYASTHPTKVRRMVMDGNVDPRRVWYKANLDQNKAFDRNINIWFRWIAKYDSVYNLGTTRKAVRAEYYKQLKRLDRKAAGGKIGGDEWTDIMLGAGYYTFVWEDLAELFSDWVNKGNWRGLKAEYDASATPGDDNGYAVYNAVQCTDAKWPQRWSTWERDANRIYKKAKFLTWDNTWYNAPCLYWKAKAGTPTRINGAGVSSALLISETLDAATPYSGSLELRKRFPNASLIALPGGTTHAGTLFGNACVDDQIADYLLTGERPARKPGRVADATCAPLPQPNPTAAKASALRGSLSPALRDLLALR